ncbi:MAG: sulfite exporter TauE/SafE family protein [Clostridiales Family XIII bacterium]|jgi:sulfite exporter TauE/SafE/copper chaperone CopZ|nr:sulfite exporter TauE/SafE family protein [Clostridiales Family XIII bacterium]
MGTGTKSKRLRIGGMTCISCQNRIEKKLRGTAGVKGVTVSYRSGFADIAYDPDVVTLGEIGAVIERLDYEVLTGNAAGRQAQSAGRTAGLLLIIAALFFLLQQFGILNLLVPSQLAQTDMGYGMLFVIGLVTSVHCLAMCGGINLSQSLPKDGGQTGAGGFATFRSTFLYQLGRIVSYTVVGFIVGAFGSAITFSATLQGVLKLVAGVFMVIMGVVMLGVFPWMRRLVPRMPSFFARRVGEEQAGSNSPLYVGLLNGLMPCGPLQAMQIYALSTGNPFEGALSMLLFCAGTVPLTSGLGALSAALGKRFTRKVMTVGAVLVVVLGLSMFSQGWSLSGAALPALGTNSAQPGTQPGASPGNGTQPAGALAEGDGLGGTDARVEDGVQVVNSTLAGGRYPDITVASGMPVRWVIDAPQGSINGCNNRMFVQAYGIEHAFQPGENVIEFTPTETGTFRYSCWMGMIRGTINVIEAGGSKTGD